MSEAIWHYDSSKSMSYKHSSTCHGAELAQKMLFDGKVVTDPKFQIVTSGENVVKVAETIRRKWYQLWKPKHAVVIVEKRVKGSKTKDVIFRYFCTDCNKQNEGKWEFKNGTL